MNCSNCQEKLVTIDRSDFVMKRLHTFVFPILLVTLSLLAFAACGGDEEPTPAPTIAAAPAPTETPTPAPTATAASQPESPLGAPESPLPTPTTDPTAPQGATDSSTGAVLGQLAVTGLPGYRYVVDTIVGLAPVIRDDNGLPKAAGYEASTAPKAVTDAAGRFGIGNVEPGTYSIILDAVITSYQLDDETSGDTILVEVKAGEVVDLGLLEFTSLPIPGYAEE